MSCTGSGHVHVLENVSLLSLYGLETEQLSVQAIAIDNTKLHWTLSSPELKTLTKATYRRFRILNVTRFSQLSGSFSYTLSAGGNNVYTSAKAYVHVGSMFASMFVCLCFYLPAECHHD